MAKVVLIDNYNRDYISDAPFKEHISEADAKRIAKEYNEQSGPHPHRFAVVKPDDYKLYKFEP